MASLDQVKKKIDDPQLRLQAVPYKEEIVKIWQDYKSGIYPTNTKNLFRCINFFAQYAKYLPEWSYDIINMCQVCLIMIEINTNEWDAKALNKIVVICTTLLICRKEENIIRASCKILDEILSLLPINILNPIVQKHSKTLSFVLSKLTSVKTNYTQVKILRVFFLFTQYLVGLRIDILKKHHLVVQAPKEVVNACFQTLSQINLEDYYNTSREFLKLFNTYLVKKIFVLSTEGYITKINGKSVECSEIMTIDFNGRNLTISFFVSKKILFNLETKLMSEFGAQDTDNNQMIFVEIECNNIEAKMKKSNSEKALLQIEISIAKLIHIKSNNSFEQRIFGFENISFVMTDSESKIRCFLDVFYTRYKSNERMSTDENNSLLDQESLLSYKTNASMLSNPNETITKVRSTKTDENKFNSIMNIETNDSAVIASMKTVTEPDEKTEKSKTVKIKEVEFDSKKENCDEKNISKKNDNAVVSQVDVNKRGRKISKHKTAVSQKKPPTRPKRQSVKKINYKDHFDLPEIEEMPPYRDFIAKKRKNRTNASQENKSIGIDKSLNEDTEEENFAYQSPSTKLIKNKKITNKTILNLNIQESKSNVTSKGFSENVEEENFANEIPSPKPIINMKVEKYPVSNSSIPSKSNDLKTLKTGEFDVLKNINTNKVVNHAEIDAQLNKMENSVNISNKVEVNVRKRRITLENIEVETSVSSKHIRIAEWIESSSQLNANNENSSNVNENSQEPVNSDESINVTSDPECANYSFSSLSHQGEDNSYLMTAKNACIDFDPCVVFRERSTMLAKKYQIKFEKLVTQKKSLDNECDPVIKKLTDHHMNRIKEAKAHLNIVRQLNKRYETAKGKLVDILKEKDESLKELKDALEKRRLLFSNSKQLQFKELMKLKKEINEAQENLKQEIWREYVDNVQKKMTNSFKKAFEI